MEEEWGSSGTDRRVVRAVASREHLGEKWSSCIVGGHVELEAEADSGVPGCSGAGLQSLLLGIHVFLV